MKLSSPSHRMSEVHKCSVCSRRFASRRLASVHWATGHCTEAQGGRARRFRPKEHRGTSTASDGDPQTSFGAELETEDSPTEPSQDLESEEETLAAEEQMSFTSVPEGDSSLDESELASEPEEVMSTPATEDTELSHTRGEVASEAEPDPSEETPKGPSSVASRLQRSLGRAREAPQPPSGRTKRKASGGRKAKRWRPEKLLCRKCGRFRSAKLCALLLHKQACLGKGIRTFECTHCPFKHFSPKLFQRHLDTHKEPKDKTSKLALKKAPDETTEVKTSGVGTVEKLSLELHICESENNSTVQPLTAMDNLASEDEFSCDACGLTDRDQESIRSHISSGPNACQAWLQQRHVAEVLDASRKCRECGFGQAQQDARASILHFYSRLACGRNRLSQGSQCSACKEHLYGRNGALVHFARHGPCRERLVELSAALPCPRGCDAVLSSESKLRLHLDSAFGCRFVRADCAADRTLLKPRSSSAVPKRCDTCDFATRSCADMTKHIEAPTSCFRRASLCREPAADGDKDEGPCELCGHQEERGVWSSHTKGGDACRRRLLGQHRTELSSDGRCPNCAVPLQAEAFLGHFYARLSCLLVGLRGARSCPACRTPVSSHDSLKLHLINPTKVCKDALLGQLNKCPKGCGAELSHPAKAALHAQSVWGCRFARLYPERVNSKAAKEGVKTGNECLCDDCGYEAKTADGLEAHLATRVSCSRRVALLHRDELKNEDGSCPHCLAPATHQQLLRHYYSRNSCALSRMREIRSCPGCGVALQTYAHLQLHLAREKNCARSALAEEVRPTPCPKGCGTVLSHPAKAALHAQSAWGCRYARLHPQTLSDSSRATAQNRRGGELKTRERQLKTEVDVVKKEDLEAVCDTCEFIAQSPVVLARHLESEPSLCARRVSRLHRAELGDGGGDGCPHCRVSVGRYQLRHFYSAQGCAFAAQRGLRSCPSCDLQVETDNQLQLHLIHKFSCRDSVLSDDFLPTPCPKACGAVLSHPAKAALHAQSVWGCRYARLHPRAQTLEDSAAETAPKAESGDTFKAEGEKRAEPLPIERGLSAEAEASRRSLDAKKAKDPRGAEEEGVVTWEDSESDAEEEEISLDLASVDQLEPFSAPNQSASSLDATEAPQETCRRISQVFGAEGETKTAVPSEEATQKQSASCPLCFTPLDTPAARAAHTPAACGEARYEAAIERHNVGGAYVCPKCSGRHRRRSAFLNHSFKCGVNFAL